MARAAQTRRWLQTARALLCCPTAPLREELPARFVRDFAAARPELFCRQDRFGNVLVGYPRAAARARAPLVFIAHLDHPGFWVTSVADGVAHLRFRGGVGLKHVHPGQRVLFFARGRAPALGRGRLLRIAGARRRLRTATARVASGHAEAGGFATWDFPACRITRRRIIARGCDDPLGCAALLCLLDECLRARPRGAAVWAYFTRGEELGFYGALASAARRVLPLAARIVSVECSRALPGAPQGAGVIVRVGDSMSIFHPPLTEVLRQAAERLRRRDKGFRCQRRLMDGGTCEATAFGAAGYRVAALAVPLGNYHNQAGLDGGRRRIGPEHVAVSDFIALVGLMRELARTAPRWRELERVPLKRLAGLRKRALKELPAQPLLRD